MASADVRLEKTNGSAWPNPEQEAAARDARRLHQNDDDEHAAEEPTVAYGFLLIAGALHQRPQ